MGHLQRQAFGLGAASNPWTGQRLGAASNRWNGQRLGAASNPWTGQRLGAASNPWTGQRLGASDGLILDNIKDDLEIEDGRPMTLAELEAIGEHQDFEDAV